MVSGLVGVVIAALVYILTPYATLARAYQHAFGPFYRQAHWTMDFFTPATKQQGNAWCGLAIALSLGAAAWLVRSRPAAPRLFARRPALADPIRWVALAAAVGLWLRANALLSVAYDEAFSALHAAARTPGLAWSYYMLPNNHVLHNLLNSLVFGWWAPDLVLAGRLLAGVVYLLIVALAYETLRRVPLTPALAGLGALVIAAQGPLWGFGAQNRGYALLTLGHWLAALGVLAASRRPAGRGAAVCGIGCGLGYAALPSFLFFHVAVVVFAVGSQLIQRHFDARFWRWQVAAGLAVFLFYMPVLTFSGAGALTQNRYVRPTVETVREFLPVAWPMLPTYLDYGLPALGPEDPVGRWLLLVPVLLVLLGLFPRVRLRAPALSTAAGLYALALIAGLVLTLELRRLPFHRNFVGLLSQGVALLVAGVGVWGTRNLPSQLSWAGRGRELLAGVVLLTLLGWQLWTWPAHLPTQMYFTDLPAAALTARATLDRLPPGARVAFSDESFYAAAFAREANPPLRVSLPGALDPLADYYLINLTETAPPWVRAARFVSVDTVAETIIWQRPR